MALKTPKKWVKLNRSIDAHIPGLELVNITSGGDTLPPQAGNAGEFLTTDGSTLSWAANSVATLWGGITGTLSDQTDLQNALNLKANLASPTFTGTVVLPSTTSIGTITNTELSYVDGVTSSIQTQLNAKEDTANKGAIGGYASLDGTGKIPAGQLPSYVDDVLEYANFAALPVTGTTGVIYVTIDNNKTYRWTGSAYTEISANTPAGSNTEIQFNNSGAFGASANLTWNGTTFSTGAVATSGSITVAGGFGVNSNAFNSTNFAGPVSFAGLSSITFLPNSLTGAAATDQFVLAPTWNTSGSPTALKVNATNTASGASSLLLDLQASTVSQFKVTKAGAVTAASMTINTNYDILSSAGGLRFYGTGLFFNDSGQNIDLNLAAATNSKFRIVGTPSIGPAIVDYSAFSILPTLNAAVNSHLLNGQTITNVLGFGVFTGVQYNGLRINTGFAPTSGTHTYTGLILNPTINQTGGANGITRGIYNNPTLTAAADYIAFESTNGKVILTDTFSAVTGSLAGSLLDLRQTWNTTGAPTAIKLNVTDTASNATSFLMDLQVGGSSRFNVSKTGFVTSIGGLSVQSGDFTVAGGADHIWSGRGKIGWPSADVLLISNSTTFNRLQFGGTTNAFPSLKRNAATLDVRLADDSAFANFRALNITATSYLIAGTLQFGAGGSTITSALTGNIRLANAAETDFNLLQFGGTTSAFPALKRNAAALDIRLADDSGYAALNTGGISGSGSITNFSTIAVQSAGIFSFGVSSRTRLSSPVNGDLLLQNAGATDFGLLQLGGITSSFPALKRSGTGIIVRLADNTADAPITASNVISTATVRLKGYTVATLPVGVVGDTAYVTDAVSPSYLSAAVGGGSNTVPVFYDGVDWVTA